MSSDIRLEENAVVVEGTLKTGTITADAIMPKTSQVRIGMVIDSHFMGLITGTWLGKPLFTCHVPEIILRNPNVVTQSEGSALAHSVKDELVINQGAHYKGGVRIEGEVKSDKLTIGSSLTIEKGPVKIVPPGTPSESLSIQDATIIHTTTTKMLSIGGTTPPKVEVLDLVKEIKKLRAEVDALKKKVG
jgi:hypothetical protein